MKKSNLFLILLILQPWTALYAQTGKPVQDTSKCFGIKELQYIASSLVEGRACDTLLANANKKLANRDTLLNHKQFEIDLLNKKIFYKDNIILLKDEEIAEVKLNLKKEKRRHVLTKICWIATTTFLSGGLIYFIIH